LVDGKLPVRDLREIVGLDTPPWAGARDYHTVGGLVMRYLGRVPQPSDSFDVGDVHFEVVDMDGRRVDKVLVARRRHTG
jgi:putative hemolysin